MVVHPKVEDTPIRDGTSWAPNIGYLSASPQSEILIGCAIRMLCESNIGLERLVLRRPRSKSREKKRHHVTDFGATRLCVQKITSQASAAICQCYYLGKVCFIVL